MIFEVSFQLCKIHHKTTRALNVENFPNSITKSAPSGLITSEKLLRIKKIYFQKDSSLSFSENTLMLISILSFIPVSIALQRASCKPSSGLGFVSLFQIQLFFCILQINYSLNSFQKIRPKSVKVFMVNYATRQVNPFPVSVPILNPLKTPKVYKMRTLVRNRLRFNF